MLCPETVALVARGSAVRHKPRCRGVLVLYLLALMMLTAVAVADEGDAPAGDASAPALQPTQIVADIPEEYGQLFPLHWGGGSLLHLKGRLATMGCVANTLFLYDDERWWAYNQYQIPQSNPINREFLQAYAEFVPPTTLWADCYRICEFTRTRPQEEWRWRYSEAHKVDTRECHTYEYLREHYPGYRRNLWLGIYPIDETAPCDDDFDPRVKEHVFPRLPLVPGVCIVRQQGGAYGINGLAAFEMINAPPVIVIFEGRNVYRSVQEREVIRLAMEIHELCHINQGWQWIQEMAPDRREAAHNPYYAFEDSAQGQELIALVGFESRGRGLGSLARTWRLPSDSPYRDFYSRNPVELSAELCATYLMDAMGMRSRYDYERYSGGHVYEVPFRRADLNKWLTPEVRTWLEAYMILPLITDETVDDAGSR